MTCSFFTLCADRTTASSDCDNTIFWKAFFAYNRVPSLPSSSPFSRCNTNTKPLTIVFSTPVGF